MSSSLSKSINNSSHFTPFTNNFTLFYKHEIYYKSKLSINTVLRPAAASKVQNDVTPKILFS